MSSGIDQGRGAAHAVAQHPQCSEWLGRPLRFATGLDAIWQQQVDGATQCAGKVLHGLHRAGVFAGLNIGNGRLAHITGLGQLPLGKAAEVAPNFQGVLFAQQQAFHEVRRKSFAQALHKAFARQANKGVVACLLQLPQQLLIFVQRQQHHLVCTFGRYQLSFRFHVSFFAVSLRYWLQRMLTNTVNGEGVFLFGDGNSSIAVTQAKLSFCRHRDLAIPFFNKLLNQIDHLCARFLVELGGIGQEVERVRYGLVIQKIWSSYAGITSLYTHIVWSPQGVHCESSSDCMGLWCDGANTGAKARSVSPRQSL